MKRFFAFCMIFVLLLAGCSGKKAQPEETIYEQQREGIWLGDDGSYVCVLPNGCALAFDAAELREGTWLEDAGTIVADFTSGAEKLEQWEYSVKESSVRYEYENGVLVADGVKKYAPAITKEDFRTVAEHIASYEEAGGKAWVSQAEMNMGAGTVSELWSGLENQLYTYLVQTTEDSDELEAAEEQFLNERDEKIKAVREEYAGGSIAGLISASESSQITKEHFNALLDKLS